MRSRSVVASSLLVIAATAASASAEWFADAHLGAAVTLNADVDVTTGGRTTSTPAAYPSSVAPGVRVGRWLDQIPSLGIAVTASYFGPQADLQVIPLTALLMVRHAFMKSEEAPGGLLHVYGGLGPGLFISHLSGDLGPLTNVSDTSADVGLDVRAGVLYFVEPNLGLFAEYRFTHVRPTFSVDIGGATATAATTFNTNHILVGVSFRF